jgi:hypothetical protein
MPQAGEHLHRVRFDALPRAAPVALLPPPQLGVDRVALEHETGGQAGHDRDERRAVRLARGDQAQRHAASLLGPT